ncbi:GAF domain-containing protein, partial [archaeon]
MALIGLVDVDRVWFKSKVGMEGTESPRDLAFCSRTVLEDAAKVMVVPDATQDPRFCTNPFVTSALGIRFYAGSSIEVEGVKLGSFCLIDKKPHLDFTIEDENILKDMCRIVEDLITVRRKKLLGTESDQ